MFPILDMLQPSKIRLHQPNEKLYDYCLREYLPKNECADKWHSETILVYMAQLLGVESELYAVIKAIKETIGENKTVWGILQVKGKITFELYFYDHGKLNRSVSMKKIKMALSGFNCNFPAADTIPYFMFSLNLGQDLLREKAINEVHLYVHNPPARVPSAYSYELSTTGLKLENSYYFYDPKTQWNALLAKVFESPFLCPAVNNIDLVLKPAYLDCKTICIANKKNADCLYYSGISIEKLLLFLAEFHYPLALQQFILDNRGSLDYLLFDIGYDGRTDSQGLIIEKTGFYGVF